MMDNATHFDIQIYCIIMEQPAYELPLPSKYTDLTDRPPQVSVCLVPYLLASVLFILRCLYLKLLVVLAHYIFTLVAP